MNDEKYTINTCPYCGKLVANGMGSAEMPFITSILNKFPMAKLFIRECNMHDMDYHLQIGFDKANTLFKSRMKARLKVTKFDGCYISRFIKRNWYRFLIPKIVWFVSGDNGIEAYKKGACERLPIIYNK